MKYNFIFGILVYFLANLIQVYGQASILGIVIDKETNLPLSFATVVVVDKNVHDVTDEKGYFILSNLGEGRYKILINFIGYEMFTSDYINIANTATIDLGKIYLQVETIKLNEITISPGTFSMMGLTTKSKLTFSSENLRNMAWADDITRAVARLPGMSSNDYSSKFSVRGGEADEVMFSLDGMELYEPFHQRDYSGGLFIIIDMETINAVDLSTGGFSVENGNRLSGLFDMKTKSPNGDKKNFKLGLSWMNASINSDGTFAKKKGHYLFSARRGMLDQTLKLAGNLEFFPKYYDGFAKVEYQLNEKHSLSIHALHSFDKAFINNSPDGVGAEFDQFDSQYKNTYGWLTLKSLLSNTLSARTIIYSGLIDQVRTGGYDKYDNSDKGSFTVSDLRKYTFLGAKQDWSYEKNKNMHFKFGFEAKQVSSDYNYVNSIHELRLNAKEEIYNFDRELNIKIMPSGLQAGTYFLSKFKLLPKLFAETGLRYDYTEYSNDKDISPRASLLYSFSNKTSLRAGWGYYYQSQFVNNIDVNNGNTNFNPSKLAKHYVLGFQHQFAKGLHFRMEAYYKDMSRIPPLWQNLRDHLENYPEARNDNARVIFNGITSKGIELYLRYDEGKKFSWWLSYALASATDDVKDIEFDGLLVKKTGKVPRLNDQRHTIYADINYRPTPSWTLNMYWQFYYGWPRTDYTYDYQKLSNGDLHFYQVHSGFNEAFYPAYHKMDIRANKKFTFSNWKLNSFIHIINVYNRKNLKKFDLDTRTEDGTLSLDAQGNYVPYEDNKYWLGFLPVLGVSVEF
jgi:hypothetical protein